MPHTPGPWFKSQIDFLTNEGQRPVMTGADDNGDRKRICVVDPQSKFKRGEGWKSECQEREANVRLIAAAPALLEACKAALPILKRFLDENDYQAGIDAWDKTDAAINLAEGR